MRQSILFVIVTATAITVLADSIFDCIPPPEKRSLKTSISRFSRNSIFARQCNSTSPKHHAGAIAGGVIGTLAGLTLICTFILWFLRRKKQQRTGTSIPTKEAQSESQQQSDQSQPILWFPRRKRRRQTDEPAKPTLSQFHDGHSQPILLQQRKAGPATDYPIALPLPPKAPYQQQQPQLVSSQVSLQQHTLVETPVMATSQQQLVSKKSEVNVSGYNYQHILRSESPVIK